MNITNAIYDALVAAQPNGSNDFQAAEIQADAYEELKPVTIRCEDVFGSELAIGANNEVNDLNALLDIKFLIRPTANTLAARLAARDKCDSLAKEIALVLWQSANLQGICTIGRILKRNDWIKPGNIKTPTTTLRVEVNPE